MRILIVGAGIAGPTAAYWLRRSGHDITIVEQSREPRKGGYLIDFWGAGFDVADRMGIVPALFERGYVVRELREVDDEGRRVSGLDPQRLIDVSGGRYVTIARSDLASIISDTLDDGVEAIFGDTVEAIDDRRNHRPGGDAGRGTDEAGAEPGTDSSRPARVTFASGGTRDFDLVLGADGLHSRVRALVFGNEAKFERPLSIAVAAYEVAGYEPRDELVAITHTEIGMQFLRFALRDGSTLFLFTFRHDGRVPRDADGQRDLLRTALAGAGGEAPRALGRLDDAHTFYLDTASQIRMSSWSRGRVGLIGDAASCPSLLAGQGTALAMVEAYTLAAELERHAGDHVAAFAAYETRLAHPIREKQNAARGLDVVFAPRNRRQLLIRSLGMRAATLPFIWRFVMRASLRESIELPAAPAAWSVATP